MSISVFDLAGHFIPTCKFRFFSYESGEVFGTAPVFEICKASGFRDIMVMDWTVREEWVEVMI